MINKLKLSTEQKKLLLNSARYNIQKHLGIEITSAPDLSSSEFNQKFGLFVTLTINDELRGCIGFIEGIKPLREAIEEMAIQAAFHDPRFTPLNKTEFQHIAIEISILYPVENVTNIEEIMVGRDGLIMERGYNRGLLLPQVATEYGWDRETFMNQTCRKAGMEAGCWKNGAMIKKFEAEIFNESQFK